MPPQNNQSIDSGRSGKDDAEVIAPIKVLPTRTGDSGSFRKWAGPVALILCLVTLVVAGSRLIHYLHNNPVSYPQQAQNENPLPATDEAGASTPPDKQVATETAEQTTPRPEDEVVKRTVSEEVLALMARGRDHESKSEYADARDAYREAYEIDKQYEEAGIALKRVSGRIVERDYRRALSAGLKALEKNEYDQARKYLIKAKSLKPGAGEAPAALAKLNQAVRRNRISSLRQKGQKAEAAENWEAAKSHYADILALEPDNKFASLGVDRAQDQMRVLADIQFFVGRPETLFGKSNLEKAQAVVREAKALEPRGSQLNLSLGRLEEMIAMAQRPIRVTITSDNQTRVDVYRVGRLGRFTEKRIDLKPGVYTIVGHREGYQDVRHEIVIQPGQETQRVTVICKVKV